MSIIEFTDEEKAIWEWWQMQSRKVNLYVLLSDEDKRVFSTGLKIQDDEASVIRSRKHYVQHFYNNVSECKYSFEQVFPVVIKKTKQMHLCAMPEPKTESDVYAYVFAKLLSVDEQNAFREEYFLQNREKSQQSVCRFANLSVMKMVEIGAIQESSRLEKEREIFELRWTHLLRSYDKNHDK